MNQENRQIAIAEEIITRHGLLILSSVLKNQSTEQISKVDATKTCSKNKGSVGAI